MPDDTQGLLAEVAVVTTPQLAKGTTERPKSEARAMISCAAATFAAAAAHDDDDDEHWPEEPADHSSLVERQLARVREHLQRTVNAGELLENDDDANLHDAFPMSWFAQQLGLSSTSVRVLWLLVAHELCPHSRELLRAMNTEQVCDPTIDTIRRAVYGTTGRAWRELGPDGRLQRFKLIERTDGLGEEAAEYRHTYRVGRRVLALLFGEHGLDAEVSGFARLAEPERSIDQLKVAKSALESLDKALAATSGVIIVQGRLGTGRRSMLVALADDNGHRCLTIDARRISTDRVLAAKQLRLVSRECTLFGVVPLFAHLEYLAGKDEIPSRLDLLEGEFEGLVLATASGPSAITHRWRTPPRIIDLPSLTGLERAVLWAEALPAASDEDAEVLATLYPLSPALIRKAGATALRLCGTTPLTASHIETGIRTVVDDGLLGLAKRVPVRQSWSDLVVPNDQLVAIIELLARIRKRRRVYEEWGFGEKVGRGLGVSALFSGPPGTGKTMCAGLIGKDLGTAVYQVDLSKIVSKWIGETEKNLASLFDAAEAGHAILLFDEADSLFGKRTDVRSSNDRHANQEVNYLLQRLESFSGICILTTNHESAIDEAFRRRLSVHVRFPVPDADERTKLWEALIPKAAATHGELRLETLGEAYVMSGGYIRNAVLRAAFLAADEDSPITASHLTRAAQLEYEAMGKIVASRDLARKGN